MNQNQSTITTRQSIEVKMCPQCGTIYLERPPQQCFNCKKDLIQKKMLVRWEIERILFLIIVGILMIVSWIMASTSHQYGEESLKVWDLLAYITTFIVCAYGLGHYFFRVPKFKKLIDIDSSLESHKIFKFSWKRFAFEFLYMFVPIVLVSVPFILNRLLCRH